MDNMESVENAAVPEQVDNTSIMPITQLSSNQQRFIQLYLTGQYSQNKLAQLLDVHINTITTWLRNPNVKAVIADMQKEQHEAVSVQLKSLQNKAISAMYDLLDSPIDAVKLQAAKDILDRGGHKAKQEIKIDKTVMTFEQKLHEVIDNAIDVNYYDAEEGE